MPFYYAALTNCGVYYLVDPARLASYLKNTRLEPALFDKRGCVSFNYQLYVSHFSTGASITQEIELSIVAYPQADAAHVPPITLAQYLRGEEQTKNMGHHRVHVPCDNDLAIQAGETLFGEPKFKTNFAINMPSLNSPEVKTWQISCRDPQKPNSPKGDIFSCEIDLQGLNSEAGNFSPTTEYGTYQGQPIAARWNILLPYATYLLAGNQRRRVQLSYGQSTHPMRKDMQNLIGDAPAAAVQIFQSPPIAIQSRAFYV